MGLATPESRQTPRAQRRAFSPAALTTAITVVCISIDLTPVIDHPTVQRSSDSLWSLTKAGSMTLQTLPCTAATALIGTAFNFNPTPLAAIASRLASVSAISLVTIVVLLGFESG